MVYARVINFIHFRLAIGYFILLHSAARICILPAHFFGSVAHKFIYIYDILCGKGNGGGISLGTVLNLKHLRYTAQRVTSVFADTKAGSGYCRYPHLPFTKLVPSQPQALRCDLFLICNHHAATDRYPLYHPTGTLHGLCVCLLLAHACRRAHKLAMDSVATHQCAS